MHFFFFIGIGIPYLHDNAHFGQSICMLGKSQGTKSLVKIYKIFTLLYLNVSGDFFGCVNQLSKGGSSFGLSMKTVPFKGKRAILGE